MQAYVAIFSHVEVAEIGNEERSYNCMDIGKVGHMFVEAGDAVSQSIYEDWGDLYLYIVATGYWHWPLGENVKTQLLKSQHRAKNIK